MRKKQFFLTLITPRDPTTYHTKAICVEKMKMLFTFDIQSLSVDSEGRAPPNTSLRYL